MPRLPTTLSAGLAARLIRQQVRQTATTSSPWIPSAVRPFSVTAAMPTRVSDVVAHDHRELEAYYDRILNGSDADEMTRYQNLFVWELARHSIGEELVVYPVIEKSITGGKELVARDREDHQKVKEKLYKFQSLKATDQDFLPTLNDLFADLKQHIKDEESEDLVKLEEALHADESEALALSFGRTKMFVPTRSHPSAPDKPPFETVVGLLTAPLDKLADLFRRFPKE